MQNLSGELHEPSKLSIGVLYIILVFLFLLLRDACECTCIKKAADLALSEETIYSYLIQTSEQSEECHGKK